MIERREDLPFRVEVPQYRIGIHAALDELDRYALLVLLVRALREVHGTHAAAAEPLQDLILADDLTDQMIAVVGTGSVDLRSDQRLFDEIICLSM
jgi:hypothetical protein